MSLSDDIIAELSKPKQWEYRREKNLTPEHEELNRLGLDGWELVSVTCSVFAGQTTMWWYYFKRELA